MTIDGRPHLTAAHLYSLTGDLVAEIPLSSTQDSLSLVRWQGRVFRAEMITCGGWHPLAMLWTYREIDAAAAHAPIRTWVMVHGEAVADWHYAKMGGVSVDDWTLYG